MTENTFASYSADYYNTIETKFVGGVWVKKSNNNVFYMTVVRLNSVIFTESPQII